MKSIKVRLYAEFKKSYSMIYCKKVKKGTKVFIDRVKGFGGCRTGLMVRIVNLWKKPRWFDSEWFKFEQ